MAIAVRTRRVVLGCWVLLAATLTWSQLAGPVTGPGHWLLLALLLGVLLAPLPGLWRGERRTHAWATLCLAPVLAYALTETVANPAARWPSAAVLLLSLLAFVALVAHLRATRGSGR